jgi:hypothetical protein
MHQELSDVRGMGHPPLGGGDHADEMIGAN